MMNNKLFNTYLQSSKIQEIGNQVETQCKQNFMYINKHIYNNISFRVINIIHLLNMNILFQSYRTFIYNYLYIYTQRLAF